MKAITLSLVILCGFLASANAQTSIRNVDFKNFTYKLSCGDADKSASVTVKNGRFDGNKNSFDVGDVEVHLIINEVLYGDFDGDKKDEAVVLYMCGSGASYAYFGGLVFKIKNRKPILLSEIKGGNKGDGGFHKVNFEKNLLIVQRYSLPTTGSPCCPEFIETTKYKLKGERLIQIGKTKLRKIPQNI